MSKDGHPYTRYSTTDMRRAARGIRAYVQCYTDPEAPEERLTDEQVGYLQAAAEELDNYLRSEGA